MQINSSLNTNNAIPSQSPSAKKGVKAVAYEKVETSAKPIAAQTQLVSSERAIALIEREQNQKNSQQALYDQPSKQSRSAVAAYQSVGNQAQREDIQSMLGVDLFA